MYIRFQIPHPDKYSADNKWSVTTWPNNPEAVSGGKLVYPISQDPNDYAIYLTRFNSSAYGINAGQTGHHIKIGAGINTMGYRSAVLAGNNVEFHRGLHYTMIDFISPGSATNVRSQFYLNRVRCTDGAKIHVSRGEWKFGGPLESIRSAFIRGNGNPAIDNIYCKDCTIGDYHDLCTPGNGQSSRRYRWRNCTFSQIYDDGIQHNMQVGEVEMGYCFFYASAYGGGGQNGSEGNPAAPAQWYFHHNICDLRQERGTNWKAQPHPIFPCSRHSADGSSPWKVYNNLIIFGPDCEEELGPCLANAYGQISNNLLTGAANMYEHFNSILLRVFLEGTKRYDAVSSFGALYSDNHQSRSDFVVGRQVRYSAALTNELADYNCYWRAAGMNVSGLLTDYARGNNDTVNSYATLAAWKASSEFTLSKSSGARRGAYADGFDGNSTESKPTIPTIDNYPADRFNYRPSPTAAVMVATTSSLSGADWWTTPPTWGADYFSWSAGGGSLAPSAWKGALDPNGTTIEVGVLNP